MIGPHATYEKLVRRVWQGEGGTSTHRNTFRNKVDFRKEERLNWELTRSARRRKRKRNGAIISIR